MIALVTEAAPPLGLACGLIDEFGVNASFVLGSSVVLAGAVLVAVGPGLD